MSTKFPEIFESLAEPFPPQAVKILPKGGGIRYVTARTVMNRLDSVLGPENWWDEYTPHPNCVVCRLTVRLPNGDVLTKVDAGGHAGMADEGDDEKSGYSDAFKRAAVKFGVGRHLYGDGIPAFDPPVPDDYDGPRTNREFMEFVKSLDPNGDNGVRADLVAWGAARRYPDKVGKWSDSQSREGYLYIAARLDAAAAT